MRNTTIYHNIPKTFRRSSRQIFKKWGSNLQNVEKMMRAIYISDGYHNGLKGRCKYWLDTGDISVFTEEELTTLRVFLQCDQSGAEALIVAYEAEAADFRQLFIHGIKPHVYVALKLFRQNWAKKCKEFNLPIDESDIDILDLTPIPKLKNDPNWSQVDKIIKKSDEWKSSERFYYLAKQTCHSANYGIEGPRFRMNILEKSGGKINVSDDEARMFLETYRGLFPEVPARCQRVRQQVDKAHILFNFFGHPYTITNYNITEHTYKEYYAWCPQSTVGEITRIAFTSLQMYIEQNGRKWDVLADTHDSYLVQAPITEVKECREKMQEFMNQPFTSPTDGAEFNMRSECQVGFSWGPYKKDINDLGLRELKWI